MRIGVVVPWCSEAPTGGVERHALMLVKQFNSLGHQAEILTTTGYSSFTGWDENFHEPGEEEYQWGKIRRFVLDPRNIEFYNRCFAELHSGKPLTWLTEQKFLLQKVSSRDLYKYVYEQGSDYTVVGMPYYYGLVHWALRSAQGRTVLIPCLHDEPEAWMKSTARLIKQVSHVALNSDPELELLGKCVGDAIADTGIHVVGAPVETQHGDAQSFIAKYGINRPFLLYVGRKVLGKGIQRVLELFYTLQESGYDEKLALVLIGSGDLKEIPSFRGTDGQIFDLGEVNDDDKFGAMAAATALVHFSPMESFSLVLMESWLQGTPVIVPSNARVLSNHVQRSGGGWVIENEYDFLRAVRQAIGDPITRNAKGDNGRMYATSYTGTHVAERLLEIAGL